MWILQTIRRNIRQFVRVVSTIFSIAFLLFVASPNDAFAYGAHGYGYVHNYGHHGYGYRQHGYRGHYRHHGHIGTAGYVFLGILGVAVLSQILDNENDQHKYRRKMPAHQPVYNLPTTQPRRASNKYKTRAKPVYTYADNAGWDWLAKGNADHALDIFAIQSQQNINSGIPKVGFAIAAAKNGEADRAIRAMRKAIRIDASALDKIEIKNIQPTLKTLSKNYQKNLNIDKKNPDNAFMAAVFSYLQEDYTTAYNFIAKNDRRPSANNLRTLIKKSN